MKDVIDALSKLLEPLRRQVNGMVRRVVLTAVNDTPGRQTLQVQDGVGPNGADLLDGVEHWQPFGLRAYAPIGVDAIGFAVGGWRNHMVALAASPKIKGLPALQPGDVLLYCLDPKTWGILTAAGTMKLHGNQAWRAELDGLEAKQFVQMTPGQTLIQVGNGAQTSKITITPGQVEIDTASFVHP